MKLAIWLLPLLLLTGFTGCPKTSPGPDPVIITSPDGSTVVVGADAPPPPPPATIELACQHARDLKCSDVPVDCAATVQDAIVYHKAKWARLDPSVGPLCWLGTKDLAGLRTCGGLACP